jgi:endonuclease YncB( thermonuclease family)
VKPGFAVLAATFAVGLAVGAVVGPAATTAPFALDAATAAPARAAPPATVYQVEVLRVIDGDTFDARVRVWPGMEITTKVRIRDIDAAEFNGRCDEERRLAQDAHAALVNMLAEGQVTIGRVSFDKYGGRVLADAYAQRSGDVSAVLLERGLVRRYSGGRRVGWC